MILSGNYQEEAGLWLSIEKKGSLDPQARFLEAQDTLCGLIYQISHSSSSEGKIIRWWDSYKTKLTWPTIERAWSAPNHIAITS